MTPDLEAKLQRLEEQLAADPESEELRQEILYEYLAVTGGEPRRIHHATEYIRRFPRNVVARAPFVHVDQQTFPEAFAQIEQEWLRLRAEHPDHVGRPQIPRPVLAKIHPAPPPGQVRRGDRPRPRAFPLDFRRRPCGPPT